MWPPGHIGIAYLCYTAYTRGRYDADPADVPVLVVVFGSLVPDLVDKPLAWYLGVIPTGRTLAHSLLVLVPLCTVVYLAARYYNRTEYGVAFAIGAVSHSLVDAAPALWREGSSADFLLWPLLPVEEYEEGAPSVTQLFLESLSDPYFLSEFVFLSIALLLWSRAGYPGLQPIRAALDRF